MTALDPGVGVDVEGVLRSHGQRIHAVLMSRIPDGQPDRWLYDLVRDYPARPAKHIRPAICLATAVAFGGEESEVVLPAVAIEMLHNAFLVHDDIADGSLRRRGEPTLHAGAGVGLALNAGDALAVLAQRTIREALDRYPVAVADRVADEFDTMMARTVEGQAIELGWCRDGIVDLTPEDYLDLIMHKTCWYTTIHPMRVGALVGSRGRTDLAPMIRFGFYLGAAFQIRDDLLNLIGSEAQYGKEILGDLHEGKRTLMLIHLVGAATPDERRLLDRYLAADRSERTDAMVEDVHALMLRHRSIDFAAEFADGIAGSARDAFEVAFASATDNEGSRFIEALIPYMLERIA
ncbi:MAG: polyprenyl synthetase family protein [Acidimicrobiales bacterium]